MQKTSESCAVSSKGFHKLTKVFSNGRNNTTTEGSEDIEITKDQPPVDQHDYIHQWSFIARAPDLGMSIGCCEQVKQLQRREYQKLPARKRRIPTNYLHPRGIRIDQTRRRIDELTPFRQYLGSPLEEDLRSTLAGFYLADNGENIQTLIVQRSTCLVFLVDLNHLRAS